MITDNFEPHKAKIWLKIWRFRRNILSLHPLLSTIAEVAQLVEQRIRNAWVTGSSPVFGSHN